jgi:hypothetical protein
VTTLLTIADVVLLASWLIAGVPPLATAAAWVTAAGILLLRLTGYA